MTDSENKMPVGRPFEKGTSGNPAGRPKGRLSRSTLFRNFMDLIYEGGDGQKVIHPETGLPMTNAEVMAMNTIRLGLAGDKDARKESLDSTFGKSPDIVISDPDQIDKIVDFVDDPDQAARLYDQELKDI